MRTLLLPLLALIALPALAQSPSPRADRRIIIDVDSTSGGERLAFRRPGGLREDIDIRRLERDGVVVRRLNGSEADTIRFRIPSPNILIDRVNGMMGPGGPFSEFFGAPGVSEETRERMQSLDERSHDLAREARAASGTERDRLERDLDGVLAELFDVRADARREHAAHLRAEADKVEAGLRERDARREAILDARRRELLGESDGADW
ncbi:MAG TPA: hypothetical protein VF594_11060 [Rubricoccaceae bacterium]|jgi:hypothetical protein